MQKSFDVGELDRPAIVRPSVHGREKRDKGGRRVELHILEIDDQGTGGRGGCLTKLPEEGIQRVVVDGGGKSNDDGHGDS